MPVEQLIQEICDRKQGYTQFGGLRPFGVSLLYAGWDRHHRFQLYHSDPSGNYGGWKAYAIGAHSQVKSICNFFDVLRRLKRASDVMSSCSFFQTFGGFLLFFYFLFFFVFLFVLFFSFTIDY